VITPWNWPYTMPTEIVAPALAVGNTVVWTPAPSTAVCSGLLAECVAEADLPPGVFNFVLGPGPVVGDELVANPGTVAVGFIGSTATGRRIAERGAGKRMLLEMGGNGPLVVLDGADLDAAAQAAVSACFLCAGQSCTAGERLLVHEAVRKDFVAALAERALAQSRLGDPLLEDTQMGPLNNEPVAAKMDVHVRDAVTRGAAVVAGGERAGGFPTDLYWPATILDGVPADAHAATEETFGPIAPIVAIASLEDAIEQTNASPYGLMAAIFTNDLRKGLRFAGEVRTGLVNINETTNYWENHLPFGGRAGTESGTGRVGGRYPFEVLTELQTVVIGPR
jgi:acyl-CoA reductase-like NAD-dependent aldehyde dehydrogenase